MNSLMNGESFPLHGMTVCAIALQSGAYVARRVLARLRCLVRVSWARWGAWAWSCACAMRAYSWSGEVWGAFRVTPAWWSDNGLAPFRTVENAVVYLKQVAKI